ncbi:MAG TPA: 16S rRNA (uracil(1498)-N(3))-methyltransferase [Desulfobacteraceae bacterium]|nr:16S rRNA (uracil(1498)-N(3))-methyltransferase [Desulfobacteraceae bacterium]
MRRFFINPQSIQSGIATLSGVESHHITSVLRLEPGSAIELFDGTGFVYGGRIETVARHGVRVRILSRSDAPPPSAAEIILVQSFLREKKMDLVIQKATEMGIHMFQPLKTRYSEVRGHHQRQFDRWNRIMLEACKQSRRARPMLIAEPLGFQSLSVADGGAKIMFWEGEKTVALNPEHVSPTGTTWLLLGPEGGFHPEEIDLARQFGFLTVSLGGSVLRAETASMAAMAIVQYLVGALAPPP